MESKDFKNENKKELFDFDELKVTLKKIGIRAIWIFMISVVVFGMFKIIKWGSIFNRNYIEYVNKKEDINLPTILGNPVISYEDQLWISNFIKKLQKLDLDTVKIETSTSSSYTIFSVKDKNSKEVDFDIKINTKNNIESVWHNFVSIYMSDEMKSILKKKQKIEYLDLRFDSKVFYKLNSIQEVATSTEATLLN